MRCDGATLSAIERRLAGADHELIAFHQVDTYFAASRGRLKVREIHAVDGNTVELIAYARPDDLGTRLSVYERVPIPRVEGAALLSALRTSMEESIVVEKIRRVAIMGRTRVHLDRVSGLGTFVELETVLEDGDDEDRGRAESAEVAATLGIEKLTPIAGSYSDLLRSLSGSDGALDADR